MPPLGDTDGQGVVNQEQADHEGPGPAQAKPGLDPGDHVADRFTAGLGRLHQRPARDDFFYCLVNRRRVSIGLQE